MSTTTPIHDYDGNGNATYRQDFWENANRDYEDRVERIAISRLLEPVSGKRLLELGAGFGRLSSLYDQYDTVILVDYSHSQLEDARSRLGDEKYIYVAANIYQLPFADGSCDAATMIRVLHHFADVPAAFEQIRSVLSDGALFILEYANKRNLKAMLRYRFGQQSWNPSDIAPIEFVKLHFDFHPDYIRQELNTVGFTTKEELAVSYLRLGILKSLFPSKVLAGIDAALQRSAGLYSPSVFTQNQLAGARPNTLPDAFFKCPKCQSTALQEKDVKLVCTNCHAEWGKSNGVYDFREPLEA